MSTVPAAVGVRRATLRVRYAETDQMGVVYYANYLVWFEVGRTDWLREAGLDLPRDGGGRASPLPVIEAHCEYRQPARYDDELEIETRAILLTPVRLRFDYASAAPQTAPQLAEATRSMRRLTNRAARAGCPSRVRELLGARPGQPG